MPKQEETRRDLTDFTIRDPRVDAFSQFQGLCRRVTEDVAAGTPFRIRRGDDTVLPHGFEVTSLRRLIGYTHTLGSHTGEFIKASEDNDLAYLLTNLEAALTSRLASKQGTNLKDLRDIIELGLVKHGAEMFISRRISPKDLELLQGHTEEIARQFDDICARHAPSSPGTDFLASAMKTAVYLALAKGSPTFDLFYLTAAKDEVPQKLAELFTEEETERAYLLDYVNKKLRDAPPSSSIGAKVAHCPLLAIREVLSPTNIARGMFPEELARDALQIVATACLEGTNPPNGESRKRDYMWDYEAFILSNCSPVTIEILEIVNKHRDSLQRGQERFESLSQLLEHAVLYACAKQLDDPRSISFAHPDEFSDLVHRIALPLVYLFRNAGLLQSPDKRPESGPNS